MLEYVKIWERWMGLSGLHSLRYEDFLADYAGEAQRLAAFLSADAGDERVEMAIERYAPETASRAGKGLHFQHGKAERFRSALTPAQMERANEVLGKWIGAIR